MNTSTLLSSDARREKNLYSPRRPEEAVLYRAVADSLETLLARARQRDRPPPRFVEREFRAFLDCGILAHGFLRVRCDACRCERLVPWPDAHPRRDPPAGESVLRGSVRRVERSAFMKVSALGVEEQRVWVVAEFDDPQAAWGSRGDEYRVEARVVVWESESALRVHTGSLFRRGGDWAVYAVEDGRARLRSVAIGRRNGLLAEVLSGSRRAKRHSSCSSTSRRSTAISRGRTRTSSRPGPSDAADSSRSSIERGPSPAFGPGSHEAARDIGPPGRFERGREARAGRI